MKRRNRKDRVVAKRLITLIQLSVKQPLMIPSLQ